MHRNRILVYRRAHVHQKRQFDKGKQSHATDKKKMYAEQEILQTHVLCSGLNINQSAGNISKGNSNTEKKENGLIYSIHYLKPDESPEKCNMIVYERVHNLTYMYLLRSRSGVRCGDRGCTRGGGRAS